MKLPRLLNLPAVVAKFLTEKERTAYEAYKFVLSVAAEDESGVTIEDSVLLTSWFMAVGQSIAGTDTQALPLEFQPVTSIDANFQKWAYNHASQYLGEKPRATEAAAPQPTHVSTAGAESVLMGVTTVLQNIAGSQHKALLEVTKKSEESKPYDEWDIAALMGYCGVSSPDEVPAIWPKLKVTKKAVDQRAAIVNAMEQWSFEERKEIDTVFFLSKDVLDDILKTSVTLKIHMYRSDTKSRERNIGSYVTIHLILWRATLTFLWRLTLLLITVKHHLLLRVTLLDEKVQRPSLPVSDTMAYVPFPTFGITSNTQTWDHTPQL
jgi:hypothetical protein